MCYVDTGSQDVRWKCVRSAGCGSGAFILPRPFAWTKSAAELVEKLGRARAALPNPIQSAFIKDPARRDNP